MTAKTYSLEQKATLNEYSAYLNSKGFCRYDNSASNYTQLFNIYTNKTLPLHWIANHFDSWLNGKSFDAEFNAAYVSKSLPHIAGTIFKPDAAQFYKCPYSAITYANTYRRFKSSEQPLKPLSPLIDEFFERMFPIELERITCIQWMAHMFQRPQERPSFHLMLPSTTGAGKGFLVNDMLHPILIHTATINSFARVTGTFSTVLEDNLLVLLDDPKSKSDSTQTILKSLMSEEKVFVERKGLQGGMVPTYARFILASNEDRPLFLESDERRWYVVQKLEHKESRKETQQFIQQLSDWLETDGAYDCLYAWFMSIDLGGFKHKICEETEGLLKMVELSSNPDLTIISDFIEETPIFQTESLMEYFENQRHQKPSSRQLPHLLRSLGYTNTRISVDGRRLRYNHPKTMPASEVTEKASG